MQLEDMSKEELIALVKRQEQELAAQPVQQPAPELFSEKLAREMREGTAVFVSAAPVAAPVDVPAASVHDLETQQYIGTRLRRVATAAGVTVDYGDDEFYYAGAFSILGDIARALEKTAASVQPVSWKDAFRRCGANPDYHGIIAFTPQQLEYFVGLLNTQAQPDSGRDAALEEAKRQDWDACAKANQELVRKLRDQISANVAQVGGLSEHAVLRASVPERWKSCTSAVGGAQSYIAELEQALNPRHWTEAMSGAWHRAIPDLHEAFAALRAAAEKETTT